MSIIKKLKAIDRLQDDVDATIWEIFRRYINIHKINFSSPDDWKIEGSRINFHGYDGCMGCYDAKSISIDIKYFENPDEELAKLEEALNKEKQLKEKREATNKKRAELRELKRLKQKYE